MLENVRSSAKFNSKQILGVDSCLHQEFEKQVSLQPQAIAIISNQESITYEELNQRANQVARYLKRQGIRSEMVVGLCMERSIEMIVGLFGILKAGAAYLPLDPTYPPERLLFMLKDADVRLVLTESKLESLPCFENIQIISIDHEWCQIEQEQRENPTTLVTPQNLCYIIYTSGSTGLPKGVMITHRSVANFALTIGHEYQLKSTDRVLQFFSISFDGSVDEIYGTLLNGATLILYPAFMLDDLTRLMKRCQKEGITVLNLPTAYWHELVDTISHENTEVSSHLRLISIGGEKAMRRHFETWNNKLGQSVQFINGYGPTECTVAATICDVWPFMNQNEPQTQIPIGKPLPTTQVYILDENYQKVPTNISGEIYIGGVQVGRGYLNQPELTAKSFVPDPFSSEPGQRLYCTGDLGCYLPDGNIAFLGRVDQQVKIRGFRVELGEVETILAQHPSVKTSVVMVREDVPNHKKLVAYIVSNNDVTLSEIKTFLQKKLPQYLIPTEYVFIDKVPLSVNGKVDRQALPSPNVKSLVDNTEHWVPQTKIEQNLSNIWSKVLGYPSISSEANFFDLGGNSLKIVQIIARVRQELKVELAVPDIFANPTIKDLAQHIETKSSSVQEDILANIPSIPHIKRTDFIPLSHAQEMIWVLSQLIPDNTAYITPLSIRFTGKLNKDALTQAFTEIIRRHEVFRTTFPTIDGKPTQCIHPPFKANIPFIDLRHLQPEKKKRKFEALTKEDFFQSFDLTQIPLIRWRLIQLDDDHYVLNQLEHHFVHDGWSLSVLMREMQMLYTAFAAGKQSPLPELPIQFADFAAWQRRWMTKEHLSHQLEYWKKQLADMPVFEVPTDYPRPKTQRFNGDGMLVELSADLCQSLRHLGGQMGATLYMVLLAAFKITLHQRTMSEEVVIGSFMANRRWRESELLIGMIVNSVALRTDFSGDPTFRELVKRIRKVVLGAQSNQDIPFESVVRELRPHRDPGRNPLFQISFGFHDAAMPSLKSSNLTGEMEYQHHNGTAKFDINVTGIPLTNNGELGNTQNAGVLFDWEFNTDLFHPSTIKRLMERYEAILKLILQYPDLPLSKIKQMLSKKQLPILQKRRVMHLNKLQKNF